MSVKSRALLAILTIALFGSLPLQAELRVGAARVDQTGPLGVSQSGQYEHERIYVRAIVLDNGDQRAALISYGGPEDVFDMLSTRQAIADELDTNIENVVVTNTHTHSEVADATIGTDDEPIEAVSSELFSAAQQAAANMRPALVSYATGMSYLNVNRDAINPETRRWVQGNNLDAYVDRSVGVLSFVDLQGAPIAVWYNYAIHPISGYVLGVVSGDVPGATSRHIEQAFDDTMVAAFTQGALGDVNTLYLRLANNAMASRLGQPTTGYLMDRETFEGQLRMANRMGEEVLPVDPEALDRLFRFIESQGQVLGEEVIRVMSEPQNWSDTVRIEGLNTSFDCPGRRRINGDAYDPATREGIQGVYEDAEPQTIRVGLLGIGNMSIATVNGEIYSAIGRRVKEEALMNDTMVVAVSNERMSGYIPDDASFGHQTFQVLNNRIKPGCAESGIVQAVVEMQNAYLGSN